LAFPRRNFLQFRLQPLNRPLKLRVASLTPGRRVVFDLDIRRNSDIFDLPFAAKSINGTVRCADIPAVHQSRDPGRSYKATPSAFADEGSGLRLFEEPRHCVATRSG